MSRIERITRISLVAALAIVVLRSVSIGAQAPSPAPAPEFTRERRALAVGDVQQQATPGRPIPQRLPVDRELLIGSAPFRVAARGERLTAEHGLSDLRLFAGDGRPVPYLLVHPRAREPEWVGGTVLGVAATKKTSGFEVDLGSATAIDMLRIEGLPVPFLKRLTLEGSGDRARWTMLVEEGTLFDLPDEGLRQDALGFAPGEYRYLRLTWNDANSGRVPGPRAVRARRVAAGPAQTPAATIDAPLEKRASEPGVSRYLIRLPAARMPLVGLELEVGQQHVHRRALVTESRFAGVEAGPVELGTAMLVRVTRDGATASALRIPIAPPSEAEIDLTIDDGENPPLDVRRVSVILAELPWIYLEAPEGPIVARYGDAKLTRPEYDLEAVRDSIDLAKVPEARWTGMTTRLEPAAPAAPAATLPNAGPVLDPNAFRYARSVRGSPSELIALPLDAHVLAFSRGPASRFADVRVLDDANHQIPYLLERRNEPLSVDVPLKPAQEIMATGRTASNGRRPSVYSLTLPHANLPPGRLVIETSARVFQRSVQLGIERPPDRRRRDAWFEVIGGETWRHADEATPARPLTLQIAPPPNETELRLVVDEGDNAPLPITAVRLLLPSYRVRLFHPPNGALRLAYGRDDLVPPQYDLALLAPKVMGALAQDASAASPAARRADDLRAFAWPRTFWIVLSVAVIVLLGLIVRLVRAQPGPTSQ
ncbi:MAG TPA: DUF3999 family protein [Vicinamibacterales bacterium]|jgi:hypothetical protein